MMNDEIGWADSNDVKANEDFAISQVESDPYDYESLIIERHYAIMDELERTYVPPLWERKVKIIIKRVEDDKDIQSSKQTRQKVIK